jgi:hypothetical protein
MLCSVPMCLFIGHSLAYRWKTKYRGSRSGWSPEAAVVMK